MANNRDEALGVLVKQYRERRGMSQATVAELLSRDTETDISQTVVSELEKGRRWARRPELPAAFARVLGIPRDEVQEAMGFPVADRSEAPTFAQIVEADATLSRAAKEHLINQYGLLQLASKQQQEASAKPPRGARRAG